MEVILLLGVIGLMMVGFGLAFMLGQGKDAPPARGDPFDGLMRGPARRPVLQMKPVKQATPVRVANCLIWALAARKRFRGSGLIMRPSVSRWRLKLLGWTLTGGIPHFLVMTSGKRRHIFSFCPIVRPEHPSLFYVSLFEGQMIWGDAHAPPSVPGPVGRFLLLRTAAMMALIFAMWLLWLIWWIWRIVRWGGELVVWLWIEIAG